MKARKIQRLYETVSHARWLYPALATVLLASAVTSNGANANQVQSLTAGDYDIKLDEGAIAFKKEELKGNLLIQICRPENCAADREAMTRLSSAYPDVEFVQMPTTSNPVFDSFIRASKLDLWQTRHPYKASIHKYTGFFEGQIKYQYPMYMLAIQDSDGGSLSVAPDDANTVERLQMFIDNTFKQLKAQEGDDGLAEEQASTGSGGSDQCAVTDRPVDGKILYSCYVKAIALVHKNYLDKVAQEKWLTEWLHKYDGSDKLNTEAGAFRAVAEMMLATGERFDYAYGPEEGRQKAVERTGKKAGIGVDLAIMSRLGEPDLGLPRYFPPQFWLVFKDMLGQRSQLSANHALVIAEDPDQGTPAYDAGLKRGDEIIAVNGQPLLGADPDQKVNLDKVVDEISGAPDTLLTLTVKGADTGGERTVRLTRKVLRIRAASESSQGDVAVIKLRTFDNELTSADVNDALRSACKSKDDCQSKALIIDLRGNPGGLLAQVPQVAEQLLDHGPLYSQAIRDGDALIDQEYYLDRDKLLRQTRQDGGHTESLKRVYDVSWPLDRPIIVLIGHDPKTGINTASGAEMLAKILQENHRAIIVGERSYGKGVGDCRVDATSPVKLPYHYSADLTCLEYKVNGKSVNWIGVTPDVEVVQPDGVKEDLAMTRAIEIAHNPISGGTINTNVDDATIIAKRKAEFALDRDQAGKFLETH